MWSDANHWSRGDRLKIWLNQTGGFIFRVSPNSYTFFFFSFQGLTFCSQNLTKSHNVRLSFLQNWWTLENERSLNSNHVCSDLNQGLQKIISILSLFTFAMLLSPSWPVFQVGICCPCHKHLLVTFITITNAKVPFKITQEKEKNLDDTLVKVPPTWLKNRDQLFGEASLKASFFSQDVIKKEQNTDARNSPYKVTFSFQLTPAAQRARAGQFQLTVGKSGNKNVWKD